MRSLPAGINGSGYLSAIFRIAAVLFIFTSVWVPDVCAQKTKTVKKKQPVASSMFVAAPRICIPTDTDYTSVMQIDSQGKATLSTQANNGAKFLFDANLLSSQNDVLAGVLKPVVTIKADPSLKFDLVVKILRGARQALDRCFNVEASTRVDDPHVYIYPEPREGADLPVFPNPLLLVVHLDKNADLTLNNEKQGSLKDASPLRNRLKEIFKAREETGVFREGTNLIEKEVRVMAAGSVRFGDVIRIVDALKEAGASPVGLQIDESENIVEMQMEILKPISPRPSTRKP